MDSLTETELKKKIATSLYVIDNFGWLLNSYVLDFFTENHWHKLPSSWRNVFGSMEPPVLANVIEGIKPKEVLPLSFMALLIVTKQLCLPRQPLIEFSHKENFVSTNVRDIEEAEHCEALNIESEYTYGTHPKLVNLFLKHVKKKKRHEIALMSDLVGYLANETSCSTVVDVGSGLGHLVRTLSYKHHLNTVGIEAQEKLTTGARKLDDQFEYTALKYFKKEDAVKKHKPHHINMMLTDDMQKEYLSETLKNIIEFKSFGLIGLHPCGDLGPLLIKIFNETPEVKFICIVGCCYMKLTCQGDKFQGYPLSKYVSGIENNHLTYEGREISCHALEAYCERLKKGLYEDLQVHTFRALLEKILISKWPHLKHTGLRSVKHYNTLTFERYCEIATERLGISLSVEDTSSDDVKIDLQKWKHVVIYYTLRLVLAPLVESVILMDRMLNLIENGASCEIRPVFNPSISPRNLILIARKMKNEA